MSVSAWLGAVRPRTLVASLLPVAVGTAYAWRQTHFISWEALVFCLGFACFMQIGANLANDYYDFRKGADTKDRKGPVRAVSSGAIKPETMKRGAWLVLALGFVLGLRLMVISQGGLPLLAVGFASVVCALLYTCGPWPLAYLGLGDLFVILFFGIIAVSVTHFVQLRIGMAEWKEVPWFPALGVGLVINNLLVVNNHRDAETDREAGKKTVVVRFVKRFGTLLYLVGVLVSMLALPCWRNELQGLLALLPVGLFFTHRLAKASNAESYRTVFAGTAALILLYGLAAVACLVWL